MPKKSLLFIVLIITNYIVLAQNNAEKSHQLILDLDFKNAEYTINNINNTATKIWLKSYASFINYLTTAQTIETEKQIKYYDQQIKNLQEQKQNDPYQHLGIADNYLFKAYSHLQINEYLWAATSYYKAQKQIKQLQNNFPDFKANYRMQIIQLMADAWFSENLPFANSTNLNATKQHFQTIINKAKADKKLTTPFYRELQIISLLLYPYIENDAQIIFDLAEGYGAQWKKNGPIENFSYSLSAHKALQYNKELRALTHGNKLNYTKQFNRLNLQLGNAYLNQLNDSALLFLNAFTKQQTNKKNTIYAQLKKTWFYIAQNNFAKSDSIINTINKVQKAYTSEDIQAQYELLNYTQWTTELIRARLLFDGGNYTTCISTLSKTQNNYMQYNDIQKLIYNYQLARAFNKLNQFKPAENYYKQAISFGYENNFYYCAYANYYLGVLYLNNNQLQQANNCLTQCTKTNSPIYQNTIHRKAKLLLNNIE